MDALLIYCDSGAPSRYLRCLEAGVYQQVLSDSQLQVASVLVNADKSADVVLNSFREHPARLVCFDIDEFNVQSSLEFVAHLKSVFPDTPVCVFGVYTILDPDTLVRSKAVDYLVIGEGEVALYELVSHIVQRKEVSAIKNLWWRNNAVVERNPLRSLQDNLDHLPFADRSLLDQQPFLGPPGSEVLYVAATRGCPYECLFCYSPVLKRVYEGKGTYYRMRSPQHIVSEIHAELHRRDYSLVVFVDEMFPCDKNWLRQFAQRLAGGRPVPFEVTLAAEKVDQEILDLLKSAGCVRIVLGIETGAEGLRRRVARRNLSNSGVASLAEKCRAMGIGIVTTNMIGLPLETDDLTQETYAYNQSLSPDEIRCTVYQAIPGTPLNEYSVGKTAPAGAGAAAEVAAPDFTHLGTPVSDISPEMVRNHLYRFHFLNILQRLRTLPPAAGYYDFLHSLPSAKFHLLHVGAVDVGTVTRDGSVFGYMLTETSSDCRFAVQLRENSVLRFSLLVPEASLTRAQGTPDRRYAAEIVWVTDQGEETLFYKALPVTSAAPPQNWQDCVVSVAPARLSGQLLFRVSATPPADSRVFVLWGMPALYDAGQLLAGSVPENEVAEERSRYPDLEEKLRETSQELEGLRVSQQELREERDEKVRRLAEIQIRMLEMERENEALRAEVDKLRAEREAGIAGKIKGIFKK